MPSVAGDQVVGGSLHSALHDAVVGMAALNHVLEPTRLNDDCGVPQCPESLGRPFLGPTELAYKNPGNFLKNEGRQAQLETSPESQFENEALVAWEVQTGDYDIGIEDDSHVREEPTSARYSSTRPATSSGLTPFSLARSSPY